MANLKATERKEARSPISAQVLPAARGLARGWVRSGQLVSVQCSTGHLSLAFPLEGWMLWVELCLPKIPMLTVYPLEPWNMTFVENQVVGGHHL